MIEQGLREVWRYEWGEDMNGGDRGEEPFMGDGFSGQILNALYGEGDGSIKLHKCRPGECLPVNGFGCKPAFVGWNPLLIFAANKKEKNSCQ